MSSATEASLRERELARQADRRLWDVLGADEEEITMLVQAMRLDRALDDGPAGDSLATLARIR